MALWLSRACRMVLVPSDLVPSDLVPEDSPSFALGRRLRHERGDARLAPEGAVAGGRLAVHRDDAPPQLRAVHAQNGLFHRRIVHELNMPKPLQLPCAGVLPHLHTAQETSSILRSQGTCAVSWHNSGAGASLRSERGSPRAVPRLNTAPGSGRSPAGALSWTQFPKSTWAQLRRWGIPTEIEHN